MTRQRMREAGNKAAFEGGGGPGAVELEVDLAAVPQALRWRVWRLRRRWGARRPHGSRRRPRRLTSIVRTARSTTLSATLLGCRALRTHRQFCGEKASYISSASVSPWVGR